MSTPGCPRVPSQHDNPIEEPSPWNMKGDNPIEEHIPEPLKHERHYLIETRALRDVTCNTQLGTVRNSWRTVHALEKDTGTKPALPLPPGGAKSKAARVQQDSTVLRRGWKSHHSKAVNIRFLAGVPWREHREHHRAGAAR